MPQEQVYLSFTSVGTEVQKDEGLPGSQSHCVVTQGVPPRGLWVVCHHQPSGPLWTMHPTPATTHTPRVTLLNFHHTQFQPLSSLLE